MVLVPDQIVEIPSTDRSVVLLSGRNFVLGCLFVAALILTAGRFVSMRVWLFAREVCATVLRLFLFGSFKYQLHKNALSYGMLMVIVATCCALPASAWHSEVAANGWWAWAHRHLLSYGGLDDLI